MPNLPPCHDLVRLVRSTQDETTQAVLDHLKNQPLGWGYRLAHSLSLPAFAGELPLSALRRACDTARLPEIGRASNKEVVELIHEAGAGRQVRCRNMPDGTLPIRKDLLIRVEADFCFVENGRLSVFWMQPRKGYALTVRQLGMFGALLRLTLLRGQYSKAEIELLDMSAPARMPRVPRTYHLRDLPQISDREVTEALQMVVNAYDAVAAMDINWAETRARRQPRDRGEQGPDLWGNKGPAP